MKQRRAVKLVNILIALSVVVALVSGGLVVASVAGPGPAIDIGSVIGIFSNGDMQLHVPVTVHNGGLLDIAGVRVDLNVSDTSGDRIITGRSPAFDIPARSTRSVNVTLVARMEEVPAATIQNLLTSNETLVLSAAFEAAIPPIAGVHGDVQGHLPWGAIISDLTFEKPVSAPYNSTCSLVSWGYSFANQNQYFHLIANLSGVITNENGVRVGHILNSDLNAPRGNSFSGNLTAVVLTSALPASGFLVADVTITNPNLFVAELKVQVNG